MTRLILDWRVVVVGNIILQQLKHWLWHQPPSSPPAMVRLVAFTTYGMNLTRTICVGGLAGGTRIYYGFSGIV